MSQERRFLIFPKGHQPEVTSEEPFPIDPERRKRQRYIQTFELPSEIEADLTKHQRNWLDRVVDAASEWEAIYAIQKELGSGAFYPTAVREDTLKRAAQTQPELLSPRTVVVRTSDGQLVAHPLYEVYARIIKDRNIASILKSASSEATKSRDMQSAIYLLTTATSLVTGDYEASMRMWLEREDEPKIDIFIDFADSYIDERLGIKFGAEAWAGVLAEEQTLDSQWFKERLVDWWCRETDESPQRIKVRIDHTKILSGQAALYHWTGNSMPPEQWLRDKYGSKLTIFLPVFEDQFKERYNAFGMLIDPRKKMGRSDKLIETASLRRNIGHEVAHSSGVASDVRERLGPQASWIKELYCDLLSLTAYSEIPEVDWREREMALADFILAGFFDYKVYTSNQTRAEYFVARSIIFKHLLQSGNFRFENGRLTWDNLDKIFRDIKDLFTKVKNLQQGDTQKDAEEFLRGNFDPDAYGPLAVVYNHTQIPPFLRNSSGN